MWAMINDALVVAGRSMPSGDAGGHVQRVGEPRPHREQSSAAHRRCMRHWTLQPDSATRQCDGCSYECQGGLDCSAQARKWRHCRPTRRRQQVRDPALLTDPVEQHMAGAGRELDTYR